ncbi:MAG: hypothetical protein LQ351_003372 [Letrouitia transgressa]|nr:MAG: hypothetical protein LQ351_003372 [Letrouitia transgressa]
MVAVSSRLVLAALPVLIHAQGLTTYIFTIGDKPTSLTLPIPNIPTTTIYKTLPATIITRTTQLPRQIATETIVLTAPVGEISAIADNIPQSYQVPNQQAVSGTPGPVIPITVNGYVTSIRLPATASVPPGRVTLSPVVVAPGATATGAAKVSNQAAGAQETPRASGTPTGIPTSLEAANSANAPSAATTVAQAPSSFATPVVPIPVTPASELSAALASASSAAAAASSNANSEAAGASSAVAAASSQATAAVASASALASAATAAASSSEPFVILSSIAGSALPTAIVTDTASFTTSTRTRVTSTATTRTGTAATSTTQAAASSSAVPTPTGTSAPTTSSPPQASSTAAPNSAVGRAIANTYGSTVAAALGIVALMVM